MESDPSARATDARTRRFRHLWFDVFEPNGVDDGNRLLALPDAQFREILIAGPSDEAPYGCRVGDPAWIYSKALYPAYGLAFRTVNFHARIYLCDHPILEMAIKRYLVAMIYFPLRRYLGLSSIRKRMIFLGVVAEWIIEIGYKAGIRSFKDVPVERIPDLVQYVSRTWKSQHTVKVLGNYFYEMSWQGARGRLTDYVVHLPVDKNGQIGVVGDTIGADSDVPEEVPERPETHQEDEYGTYLPLPDEWLEKAGWRWLYYLDNIQPNLVSVTRGWKQRGDLAQFKMRKRGWGGAKIEAPLSDHSAKTSRSDAWREFLAGIVWIDANGQTIAALPFEVEGFSFPPRSYNDLERLLAACQASLLQVVLLMSAGRRKEVMTLERKAALGAKGGHLIVDEIDGEEEMSLLGGRTYKFSGFTVGDETEWPIPSKVGKWIEDHIAIANEVMPDSSTSLWFQTGTYGPFGTEGPDLPHMLRYFSAVHGLTDLLEGVAPHPHRFRKSMVRLAVLCLEGAPLILQQILGHQGLPSILKYILTDSGIREEMREMLEDHGVAVAEEVAAGLSQAGGKGAVTMRNLYDDFLKKLRIPSNERSQRRRMREFASAMLAQGVDLKIIFPGIICIKPNSAPGKCCRAGSLPNAARCEVECQHYLALPSRREPTRGIIEDLISELMDREVQGNPLLMPWYRAQLVDQVRIFDDLRREYLVDQRARIVLGSLFERLEDPLGS